MRWYEPKSGDKKIKRKFALLPISIGKETRWLEWVAIQYKFYDFDLCIDPVTHRRYISYGWKKEKFINNYIDLKPENKYMSNETIKNFDIKIKLRGDNVYDLYLNGNHVASRGSCEGILDEVKQVVKAELMGE